MRKLIARGTAPPLHPDAEDRLLTLFPAGSGAAPAAADFAAPPGACGVYDLALTDSPAEKALVRWAQRHQPHGLGWLIPQPPLDGLAAAAGLEIPHNQLTGRRCDFFWKAPGEKPLVVEVDGSQHQQQHSVDSERDRLLGSANIDVIRVTATEAYNGSGPQLTALAGRLAAGTAQPTGATPMVWAAVQTHRLVLALCEALAAGMLSGPAWEVRLHDPTAAAGRLIGPYLGLFDALDAMWGDRSVAPDEVRFATDDSQVCWQRESLCRYAEQPHVGAPDDAAAEIRLEPARGPADELPDKDRLPMVVVRSSRLPMPMHDHIDTLPQRRETFAAADDAEAVAAVSAVMRAVFAVEAPREGQTEAIIEILSGRDCVVLLPTGAGKSMIYQLAGLCLPGRTLVVDPLVSLIEDQVESLARHGIDRAAGITSSDTRPAALDGAYFMFVSPERLQRQQFRDLLTEHNKTTPVNLAVVDEAHCVSEWGHNFRTAYLNFGSLLRRTCDGALGPPPLLALTGTASRAVLTDVMFQLGIADTADNTLIRPVSFDRAELAYEVVLTTPTAAEATLGSELRAMPARFGEPAGSFYSPAGEGSHCGIIFVPTVKDKNRGINPTVEKAHQVAPAAVVRYSGRGNPPPGITRADWERETSHNARSFKGNEATVMVSTKAFGMGIDKPNIRWILHYGMPTSIEGYYQEVGRAGRDRRPAHCVLILVERDRDENRRRLADDAPIASNGSRDDISTGLYFHHLAFPDPEAETRRLLRVYDLLTTGDTTISLGANGDSSEDDERALHRLAVLGIVDDYTLAGRGRTSSATVRMTTPTPQQVSDSLLGFVERTQPGRAAAIRKQLNLPHRSARAAVEDCGAALVGFVYETIERSRRRSLREMWLTASTAADERAGGGDTIRRRVLEYLTEGDATPVLTELTARERFAYADWMPHWEQINTDATAREWRSTSARLLGSYPDHPGLLATRAIAEMLLSDGDPADAEANLARSYQQATYAYSVDRDDLSAAVHWTLMHLDTRTPHTEAPITTLAAANEQPDAAAATAAAAALGIPNTAGHAQEWLVDRWQRSDPLAALRLTDSLRAAIALTDEALAHCRAATRRNQ